MRASSSTSRLVSSLRAVHLSSSASRPTISIPVPGRLPADIRQGHSLFSTMAQSRALFLVANPVARPLAVAALQQQIRGMKVHSSIKKRCEHCKVRYYVTAVPAWGRRPGDMMADWCFTDRPTEKGQERKWVPICHLQRESQAQTTSRVIGDCGIDLACDIWPGQGHGRAERQMDRPDQDLCTRAHERGHKWMRASRPGAIEMSFGTKDRSLGSQATFAYTILDYQGTSMVEERTEAPIRTAHVLYIE
jgi:large subunit ribosomal protein L36